MTDPLEETPEELVARCHEIMKQVRLHAQTLGCLAAKGVSSPAFAGADKSCFVHTLQQPVMLFMKGNPDAPRCGFSQKTVNLLREQEVEFGWFDILEDEAVRQGASDDTSRVQVVAIDQTF